MRLAMRTKPDSTSRIAAWASDGVIVDITDERPGWREIKSGRFKGWVPTSEIWGGDNKALQ
jgi:SH3-like domain-containing protein